MTAQITLTDLINTLRKAAANPKAHASAQGYYFSEPKETSILTSHGNACCVSGYLMLQAHADASEADIEDIIDNECPSYWVAKKLGLTELEANLAFNAVTHHEIHIVLADLLEAGLRLPDGEDYISIPMDSTYTEFKGVRLRIEDKWLDLQGLKDWMRSIARKYP